jgi:hypothetical protein
VFTRFPEDCPFCTRKLARSVRAPVVFPDAKEEEMLLSNLSRGEVDDASEDEDEVRLLLAFRAFSTSDRSSLDFDTFPADRSFRRVTRSVVSWLWLVEFVSLVVSSTALLGLLELEAVDEVD